MVGGRQFTSAEAIQRFFEKLTSLRNGEPVKSVTAAQRQRAIAAAEKELAAEGI
jgi:hypothetical protein